MCAAVGSDGAPYSRRIIAQPAVISPDPANFTPNVRDYAAVCNAREQALVQRGNTLYAEGALRTVTSAASTSRFTRYSLMAFDAGSGVLRSFRPRF